MVPFEKKKIADAIFRAAKAAGGKDRAVAEQLAELVMKNLAETIPEGAIPTVEGVQDIVEKTLIENKHARTGKLYILWRQERQQLRKEKAAVLEKEEIDDVDKRFDLNALRVLKSRYLRKDAKGKLIETPKQLFTRIAIHTTIPDLFYDEQIFDKEAAQPQHDVPEFDYRKQKNKFSLGTYSLNQYHLEAVYRLYKRATKNMTMKVTWDEFLDLLKKGKFDHHEQQITSFFTAMTKRRFMPNTPAIANFGNPLGLGSACFVMDIEDSIDGIMETLKQTAIVFKSGGGMGYNFSKLRPEGDFVSTTCGTASGPLTFMKLFDTMTEVIKQGGIRRGANMGILNSDHPDIEQFVKAKEGNQALRNFNISVLIKPEFWDAYENNKPYDLKNPRTGETIRTVDARRLFDMIVYQAWESAEPGVIFYDRVNEYNPFLEHLGPIVSTNPCGEVLLYPYESCNLGSINVWAFAHEDEDGTVSFDWDGLKEAVHVGTRFLDNVIDVNKFPISQIEEMTLNTRKIGLGIMGIGDLLYELRMSYNSKEARQFMERLMEFVNYHSKIESIELAKARGVFRFYEKSFYTQGRLPFAGAEERNKKLWNFDWNELREKVKQHGIRNSFTTVLAPTGSISMIGGCSSGIEPVYTLVYEKNVKVGSFFYVDPVFERIMRREGLYDDDLMRQIAVNRGTLKGIKYIPSNLKKVFATAMDITPEDHIRALAAFQRWTDSSISKTTNFPADATVEQMRETYLLAHKLGCKDVTVFRDSSIKAQVLVAPKAEQEPEQEEYKPAFIIPEEPVAMQTKQPQLTAAKTETLCPTCEIKLTYQEGCASCPECGWGLCSSN